MTEPALSDLLNRRVAGAVRAVEIIPSGSSLTRAALALRESGANSLPVADASGVIGSVSQSSLANALSAGIELTASVGSILEPAPPTVNARESCAAALRLLHESGANFLLVSDPDGRLMGITTVSDLIADARPPRPRMVGGLATPWGVYLTDGNHTGGVSGWAVAATGSLLLLLHLLSGAAIGFALDRPWFHHFGLDASWEVAILSVLQVLTFMVLLRSMPLAGIHAAEHMAVHAIERDEPIVPAAVRRMSRVHPRCGTNLVAGALLFLSLSSLPLLQEQGIQALLAGVLTLSTWRRVGSWLQKHVTTKPPTDAQLQKGIDAAQELLDRYAADPHQVTTTWQRLLHSGMPYILAGTSATACALYGLAAMFPSLRWIEVYL